jgi:hypothetical protein
MQKNVFVLRVVPCMLWNVELQVLCEESNVTILDSLTSLPNVDLVDLHVLLSFFPAFTRRIPSICATSSEEYTEINGVGLLLPHSRCLATLSNSLRLRSLKLTWILVSSEVYRVYRHVGHENFRLRLDKR